MSIEKSDDGRRSVRAEIEIEATPEAVWKAIATGPGVQAWFMGMESEFDERVGGEIRTKMGEEMVKMGELTAWDPPKHFASACEDAYGPGTPKAGFEWTVEAKGGGKCVLRLVHSLFLDDDSWDTQLGDAEFGWGAFFHILKNYVERHLDEPSGVVQAMVPATGTKEEAFDQLVADLELGEVAVGSSVACSVDGVPAFSGVVEDVVRGRSVRAMIRLETPFVGTGWIGVGPISGNMTALFSMYYYGEGAPEAGARDGERVNAWFMARGLESPAQ